MIVQGSFYPSRYMSDDLDKEKLIVRLRKRDADEVDACSPGWITSLLQRDRSAREKSRLRNAYRIGLTNATVKRMKSNTINALVGNTEDGMKQNSMPVM